MKNLVYLFIIACMSCTNNDISHKYIFQEYESDTILVLQSTSEHYTINVEIDKNKDRPLKELRLLTHNQHNRLIQKEKEYPYPDKKSKHKFIINEYLSDTTFFLKSATSHFIIKTEIPDSVCNVGIIQEILSEQSERILLKEKDFAVLLYPYSGDSSSIFEKYHQ